MTARTFETLTDEDWEDQHDTYWRRAGAIPEMDPDEPDAEPFALQVSLALPYRPAFDLYLAHVAACDMCSGGSIAEQCLTGDMRSQRAAQATGRMERSAQWN
jgi:hypothetical protein